MKVRMPFGRVAFGVAVFFFSLVALTPLGLAIRWFGLDTRGLAAREAEGSIWLGALREAQLGPAPIGDVSARLNSLPLLLGRARVSLARMDETQRFAGAVTVSRHAFGFDDATGQLRLGALLAPLPITAVDLQDVSIGFAGGLCSRAEGRVRALASGEVGGMSLSSGLAGNASCAGDAALLPLVGQSGMEQLNIRLFADGRYRVELAVRPTDAAAQGRLAAAGFRPAGGGYVLARDGVF